MLLYKILSFMLFIMSYDNFKGNYNALVAIDQIINANIDITKKMFKEKFFKKALKSNRSSHSSNTNNSNKNQLGMNDDESIYYLLNHQSLNPYVREIFIDQNYNLFILLHNQKSLNELKDSESDDTDNGIDNLNLSFLLPRNLLNTCLIFVSIYDDKESSNDNKYKNKNQTINTFYCLTNFDEVNVEYTGATYVPWLRSQLSDHAPKNSFMENAIFIDTQEMLELFSELENKISNPYIENT